MGFKFGKCKKLESIWSYAFENTDPDFIDFEGCDSLIRIGNQTEFEQWSDTSEHSFYGCDNLKHVSFKNCHNLQCIGRYSFAPTYNVTGSLESVDFTGCDGLRMLCAYCFIPGDTIYHHPSLISIDISPCINLEFIDSYFMNRIAGLKEFHMENLTHLTRIGSYCVSFCPELEAIYASGCSAAESIAAFAQCDKKLTHADLTGWDSLKTLGTYAFQQCSILETIIGWADLKTHLETIGSSSFESDKQLNIDISNMPALKIIENSAFNGDIAMKTCPNNCPSLETIDGYAFYGCTNLGLNDDGTHSTLDLHNNTNLTTIGQSAFEGVKAIETINLDNDTSLASLGNGCFKNNTELKHFYARNCTSLTSIGSNMFNNSSKLEDVYFSGCPQITVIPESIFSGLQTTFWMADFEDSPIVEIGARAFQNCKNLKTFKFTNGKLKKIGKQAFDYVNRTDIDQIDFEMDQCNLLDSCAFRESTIVKSLTVTNGGSAEKIGESAFYKCPNLLTVSITNVPTIATIEFGAFYQSPQLTSVDLSGCAGLTQIGAEICNSCRSLTTFKIQDSPLQAIGRYAFINCVALEAFDADSSNFSDITWDTKYGGGEYAIHMQAFEFCTSMKTFKIHIDPDNACHLNKSAFASWRNQESGITPPTYPLDVYIYGSVPPSVPAHGTDFINGANNNACQFTIHLSQAAEAAYKAAAALEEGVATDGHQFYWCCSDGSAKTATHNTGWWYGNPNQAYEDFKLPTIVFDL